MFRVDRVVVFTHISLHRVYCGVCNASMQQRRPILSIVKKPSMYTRRRCMTLFPYSACTFILFGVHHRDTFLYVAEQCTQRRGILLLCILFARLFSCCTNLIECTSDTYWTNWHIHSSLEKTIVNLRTIKCHFNNAKLFERVRKRSKNPQVRKVSNRMREWNSKQKCNKHWAIWRIDEHWAVMIDLWATVCVHLC